MEGCDQEDWNFSNKTWSDCNKFGMIISSSAPYFLEVDVRFSLKVVTKASYRGKKSSENLDFQDTSLKQERISVTKKIEMSATDLA